MKFFTNIFKEREQKTNDKLGMYPERVHVRAFPERRYLKTTRSLGVFSIITLCFVIIFTSVIYMLIPSVDTSVVLIANDRQMTGFKVIEGFEVKENALALYFEKTVSDYVKMRHEVKSDVDNLIDLWMNENSKLNLLSSKKIRAEILEEAGFTKDKVITKGLTRKIRIKWIKTLNVSNKTGVFMVNFETIDLKYGKPDEKIKMWEAFVRLNRRRPLAKVEASANRKEYENYIRNINYNPLNLQVTSYVLSSLGERDRPKGRR
jgi:type IV secretory pathway component VirB8